MKTKSKNSDKYNKICQYLNFAIVLRIFHIAKCIQMNYLIGTAIIKFALHMPADLEYHLKQEF